MENSNITTINTLSELRNALTAQSKTETTGKMPTAKQLRESNIDVIARATVGKGAELTVYKNGFFTYCAGGRTTVCSVSQCGDYRDDDDPSYQLDAAVFEYESWSLRLAMEGEKRLRHNSDFRNGRTYSYSADDNEMSDMCDPFDFAAHLADQDCVAKMLDCLTERQRQVIEMYYLQNMTQQKIADRLGTSHQAIDKLLKAAKQKIRDQENIFS